MKEKVRRGKWRVHFDNNMQLTLKPNEFVLVAEEKNQSVIATNEDNNIVIKSAEVNIIDLTCEENKKKEMMTMMT